MVEFGTREGTMKFGLATAQGSPWVLGPSNEDSSAMHVLDLRTMESTALSYVIDSDTVAHEQMQVTGASESGTLAVAFAGTNFVEVDPATGAGTVTPGKTAQEASMAGDILIIHDSVENAHWISLPDDLRNLREMWMSPDGAFLAITSLEPGSEAPVSPYTYAILDATTGSELARTESIEFMDNPRALWIQDGSMIAYASGSSVQTLAASSGAQPETILEGTQQFFSVRSTGDPDVIVATIREDHGSDADPASVDVDKVYSVNVATGETHEFAGMELGNMIGWNTGANALLIYDYIGMGPGEVTIRVYDPVTGELIQVFPNVPNPNDTGSMAVGKSSFTTSEDGQTTVYTVGGQNIFVAKARAEGLSFRQIDPPSEGTGPASAMMAPDGSALSLLFTNDEARTRWVLDLTDPAAEWLKVPTESMGSQPGTITFVEGFGT
jgi:hypothetical protein